MRALNQIANWGKVTQLQFKTEIQPLGKPAIFRKQVEHWPLVTEAKLGEEHLLDYLESKYVGGKTRFIALPAKSDGYFFYNDEFSGFNFKRKVAPLSTVFDLIRQRFVDNNSARISIQSAPIHDYFNGLAEVCDLSLFDSPIEPRIWFGNQSNVNTHYDDSENIACVIAGKRRFTLFPPEQVENLYIGPLENTPGGAPISMVKLLEPDYKKYPRFKTALDYALTAELEPGDVIYIPALWWHHVEAKSKLNGLVNFWQGGSIQGLPHPSGLDAMLMGLISIGKLPNNQKQAWKALFDHVVMSDDEDFSYIPESIRGAIGNRNSKKSDTTLKNISDWLLQNIKQ